MNALNKWIAAALLIAILLLVNFIASMLPWQADLTTDNLYTLSPGSKAMIAKIEEPVRLQLFFNRSLEDLPIRFKNYASRAEKLLGQYVQASDGRIRLEVIDPEPDSEEEEQAIRAGLKSAQLPDGSTLFLGLRAIQADSEKTIPVLDWRRESYLEYDISRLIHEVQLFEKPILGLITGLEMLGSTPRSSRDTRPPTPEWIITQELRRTFDIRRINGGGIPADIDILAVIHPRNLSQADLFAIDQYALTGKPLFIAVDPSSLITRITSDPQQGMMGFDGPSSSDLKTLFENWGVTYNAQQVTGDLALATEVPGTRGAVTRSPVILSINEFRGDSPVAAQLESVMLAEAGSFDVVAPGLELVPLLTSTAQSGNIMAGAIAFTPHESLADQVNPDGNTRIIAGFIRGTLHTAFPDGEPIIKDDDVDDILKEFKNMGVETLKQSEKPVNIFLIADTDFLIDQLGMREMNFLGQRTYMAVNDNLALAANLMEFLAGSSDLIAIRGKGAATRTFTRVEQMEREAERVFRGQLQELESRQMEIRNSLRDLQERRERAGALVADAEIIRAIENYRIEEAQVGRQLRDIRKTLREDIERLDATLAIINIAAFPLLITLFGILYFVNRSKRQRD